MKNLLIFSLLMAVAACVPGSHPVVGETSSGSESTSVAMVDMGGATGTETDTGVDPGDGDGDGSTAQTASLVVESNGTRIGYLIGLFDYGYIVWDDEHEFMFRVSGQTGHVASDVFGQADLYWYYEGPACTGGRYVLTDYDASGLCNLAAPSRRRILMDGGNTSGSIAPDSLWVSTWAPAETGYESIQDAKTLVCNDVTGSACLMLVATTAAIPKTFELPITVTESVVMP